MYVYALHTFQICWHQRYWDVSLTGVSSMDVSSTGILVNRHFGRQDIWSKGRFVDSLLVDGLFVKWTIGRLFFFDGILLLILFDTRNSQPRTIYLL